MNCPVCNTENPNESVHCKTCNWYFPLKNTEYFDLELSRARQNYQMVSSFNQMFQHTQVQSKMLEKMSFRLDGMENEITTIKENKPPAAIIPQKYDYPKLEPIMKAEDFDTPEKRKDWWEGLEEQWQKTFKMAVLQKSEYHELNDEDYKFILDSPVARFVGPRGMNPNLHFELTNLSGIKHLTNLTILVASHSQIDSLDGIQHLKKLKNLFVNCNKLTNIKEVYYLPGLSTLYCNANQITNIQPIKNLTGLEILYCCYNRLENLDGITPEHSNTLKEFVALPNDKLTPKDIQQVEAMNIFCKTG